MTTDSRKQLGRWGEELAARHLQSLGYTIIARNWRYGRGELDVVDQAGQILVFAEVKTRRGRDLGTPEEGVTPAKARQLLQLAQAYLYKNNLDDIEWRIDMVAVELDKSGKLLRCEHIPNAVTAW